MKIDAMGDKHTNGIQWSERRSEDRWPHYTGCRVAVEGHLASLQDLSPSGARVRCGQRFALDDSIRLDLPWGVPVRATVLESEDGQSRLRFEYAVEDF